MKGICDDCKYRKICGDITRMEKCERYERNKYLEHIMEILRQRLGLDEDDTSRDEEINIYTPSEAFEEVLTWEGFLGYAYTIKSWIKDIYGIDLDDIDNGKEV